MSSMATRSMRLHRQPLSLRQCFSLLGVMVVVAFVYWPGLFGGFVYDDFPFIVENDALHVTTHVIGDWMRAITSFPADHQGRWLTMLTFAINHYLSGGIDPFWLKLTNLGIHLLNGVLLFFALRALLALLRDENNTTDSQRNDHWLAFGVATAWLLLPINLTGVLYVAQRLESFSNTFVFLGLWLYFRARRDLIGDANAVFRMAAVLVLCTGVGLLAKESAVLLPAYAACAEIALGSLARAQPRRTRIVALYGALLLVPLIVGAFWLHSWIGGGTTYERSFTTAQRLMTETRVLVDYIGWCLLPLPNSLSLYHDDIALSTGLFAPATTALSILALAALVACAFWQRARRPLFCLGILWFFAGHLLTGTVIPLEIAYEHRNYFASCGLLLAVGSLLAAQRAILQPRAVAGIAVAVIAFYAFNTNLRAREWSHPLRFALAEVGKHPDSPQAQYELGRTLIIAIGDNKKSPMIPRAREALETCMALPGTNGLCAQGIIQLAARMGQPIEARWWSELTDLVRARTPTENDVSALQGLMVCQRNEICPTQTKELGDAFLAALDHPNPNPRLLGAYAEFAQNFLHDNVLAERMYRELLARKPHLGEVRGNLALFLIGEGRLADAKQQVDALRADSPLGKYDYMIGPLERMLAKAPASPTTIAKPVADDSAGVKPIDQGDHAKQ